MRDTRLDWCCSHLVVDRIAFVAQCESRGDLIAVGADPRAKLASPTAPNHPKNKPVTFMRDLLRRFQERFVERRECRMRRRFSAKHGFRC